MTKVYWNQLKAGTQIPPLVKQPITKTQIAQFAGAVEDFTPMHLDDEFAKESGFGGAYAHSVMALGIADEALRRFADNMRITKISGTFEKFVWPGDKITAKGVISKCYKKDGAALIDVEITAENQDHVQVMSGHATCLLWENPKKEKASEQLLPPISADAAIQMSKKYKEMGKKNLPVQQGLLSAD